MKTIEEPDRVELCLVHVLDVFKIMELKSCSSCFVHCVINEVSSDLVKGTIGPEASN